MAGKSKEYWRRQFDTFARVGNQQSEKDGYTLPRRQFIASVKLLLEYSSTFYEQHGSGFSGGGSCSRFWSGRWNTHHGHAIRAALGTLYGPPKQDVSVKDLMYAVEEKLRGHLLDPQGDLSRILEVIKEKTGVSSPKIWRKL